MEGNITMSCADSFMPWRQNPSAAYQRFTLYFDSGRCGASKSLSLQRDQQIDQTLRFFTLHSYQWFELVEFRHESHLAEILWCEHWHSQFGK